MVFLLILALEHCTLLYGMPAQTFVKTVFMNSPQIT